MSKTCECGCGTSVRRRFVPGHNIRTVARHPAIKHGASGWPEYHAWKKLISRCTDPTNRQYADYGGRGIKVCDRWLRSFDNFIDDVGRKSNPSLTLDRVNNDGHYEPGNVRWATYAQQMSNRRPPRKETYPRHQPKITCQCGVTCNAGGMKIHTKATGHVTV